MTDDASRRVASSRATTIFDRTAAGRRGLATAPLDVARRRPADTLSRKAAAELPQASETDVVRHYSRLSQKNRAIELGPIALGTLTSKLPPRVLDEIAGLPGFADIHPDLPAEFCQGALELVHRLTAALISVSGLDACSLQPGRAAYAKLSGLNIVRAFHEGHGSVRKIVLVPDTVPASAFVACELAGYRAMTVRLGPNGYVSPELVSDAIDRHGRDIAAMLVATPNTLGLFQPHIAGIADVLHGVGAQLYLDGGNWNALIGIAKPREMGVDLMHFDLRTFGVPPNGAGAEASAIAVREHLAPYLPGPRVASESGKYVIAAGAASSAKVSPDLGNFGAQVRAAAYLALSGVDGLREASRAAVLNANYLKRRLASHFDPVVATPSFHQCAFSSANGTPPLPALDAARALEDEGLFPPVAVLTGEFARAMCLEPTETETIDELDRLATALAGLVRGRETFDSARQQTDRVGGKLGEASTPVLSIDDR